MMMTNSNPWARPTTTETTKSWHRRLARASALARLNRERAWMTSHGGNLAGYIARYGSVNDPEHYGDGGEAIYAADAAAVAKAEVEALAAIAECRKYDE